MKSTDTITNTMDDKRRALLDNCTRALCGDINVDKKLMNDATGGRFSNNGDDSIDPEQIKTLTLALRWLGLPTEQPQVRKRRVTKKASASTSTGNGTGSVVKRRGRPKGSKNKNTKKKKQIEVITASDAKTTPLEARVDPPADVKAEAPTETQVETPVETQVETPVETQAPPMVPQGGLEGVTFEGGALPQ